MATLPVFTTWSAGAVLTAAQLNTNVRDSGNFFLSVPVFEGRQTLVQSIPNNVNTAILLDTEDIDNDNGHSTVTNTSRYTAQTQGRYQISGGVGYAANANGFRTTTIPVNGGVILGSTQQVQPPTGGGSGRVATPTQTQFLNGSGDYVELWFFQNTGGALNTDVSGGGQPRLSVRWVGTT